MSGVETNPGPDRIDILAELVCEAEDNTVKDVLRMYKPSMTYLQRR